MDCFCLIRIVGITLLNQLAVVQLALFQPDSLFFCDAPYIAPKKLDRCYARLKYLMKVQLSLLVPESSFRNSEWRVQ